MAFKHPHEYSFGLLQQTIYVHSQRVYLITLLFISKLETIFVTQDDITLTHLSLILID